MLFRSGLCAAGAILASALLFMPALARNELHVELEGVMRDMGHTMSGIASKAFAPGPGSGSPNAGASLSEAASGSPIGDQVVLTPVQR